MKGFYPMLPVSSFPRLLPVATECKLRCSLSQEFLLSVKRGEPRWELLDLPGIEDLPAVRWKLFNLERMAPGVRKKAIARLEQTLSKIA